MINRRNTLATLAVAAFAGIYAKPLSAHHNGTVVDADEMVQGDPGAPITMLEYSSLTCPHCAGFHADTLPLIRINYIETGKVRLVFRHFPFDRQALMAAALAVCSGPDNFFKFADVLFASQNSWSRADDPKAALIGIGRLGGLKPDAINACFEDKPMLEKILANRVNGAKEFGIDSTPTFIVNGEKLVGNLPYNRFVEVFERILAG